MTMKPIRFTLLILAAIVVAPLMFLGAHALDTTIEGVIRPYLPVRAAKEPVPTPMQYLIRQIRFSAEGVGTPPKTINMTFFNMNMLDVMHPTITCMYFDAHHTKLRVHTETLYTGLPVRTSVHIPGVSMGYVEQHASRADCQITKVLLP